MGKPTTQPLTRQEIELEILQPALAKAGWTDERLLHRRRFSEGLSYLTSDDEPGLTLISLRSKSDQVDVNQIAAQFGGGGHHAAAGARLAGPPLSVQRQVLAALKRALNSAR